MSGYRPVPRPSRDEAPEEEEVPGDDHSQKQLQRWLSQPQMDERSDEAPEDVAATERGWKPTSMGAPTLVSFAAFSILLAVCIEMLARRSSEHGGLALSPSINEMPRAASIGHKYAPIVVATVYSMVWNWVDQDVKRMQPWFELSKPQGATGEDSLLLSYSHDFFALVLLRAAKKKHWVVLLSGSMMTAILFLLTPLQASIMGIRSTVKNEPIRVVYGTKGNFSYPGGFLSKAYNIKKYQHPFPLFTSPDYALLPFFVDNDAVPSIADTNITATTIKFWTELACWQPSMDYPGNKGGTSIVSIPQSDIKDRDAPILAPAPPLLVGGNHSLHIYGDWQCKVDVQFNVTHEKPYSLYYHTENPIFHIWKSRNDSTTSHCGSTLAPVNQLVTLVWSRLLPTENTAKQRLQASSADEPKLEVTPCLCRREYYRQAFEVTVAADDYKLDENSLKPVSERLPLDYTDLGLWTYTNLGLKSFEESIQGGSTMYSNADGWTADALREALPVSIESVDIDTKAELVKWLFVGQNVSMPDLADPKTLVDEFNRVRSFLFSIYSYDLMTNNKELVKLPDKTAKAAFSQLPKLTDNTAKAAFPLTGILVSRPFSALVESLLVLNAAGSLVLLWLCRKSLCRLESNPNSILRLSRLCQNGRDTVRLFEKLDMADAKTLTSVLAAKRFRLSYGGTSVQKQLYIETMSTCDGEKSLDEISHRVSEHGAKDSRHFELTRKAGAIFFLLLATASVVLIVMKRIELGQGGLRRPTDSFEALQILEKYLPSGFGTALGAIWVILNRQCCVLEPFRDLCAGKAAPERSIATTYSAIPPQLTVWRAVKARHYVLTVLCLTCLLAQLLSISLGTLFNENTALIRYPQRFEPAITPSFSNQSLFDFHRANKGRIPLHDTYLLYADMTSTTRLPPWTSRDYFFQSFRLEKRSQVPANASYAVTTRGFGVRANCTPVDQSPPPERARRSECRSAMDFLADELNVRPPGNGTTHCSRAFISPSALNDTGACGFDFVAGWARTEGACGSWAVGRSLSNGQASTRATAVYCRPFLDTDMFDVVVDAKGNVYSYNRTKDVSRKSDLNYPGFDVQTRVLLRYAISFPDPGDMVPASRDNNGWHGEASAQSWMSMFLAVSRGSRDFLDPDKPPPKAAELVPPIEEIYRRSFAIFLGRHPELFDTANARDDIAGDRLVPETRIFLNQTSFIISLVVMSVNMIVAVFIYARPAVRVLPRMPTCIASTMAYVAPSRLVAGSGEALDRHRLSFGRYVGLDGKAHTGIELDHHVTPIKPSPRDSAVKGALRWRRKPGRGVHQSLEKHQSPDEP